MAKARKSIPQVNKVKAELQKEINSICPFCSSQDVGHFEVHHIDGDPSNNENRNLLLLCPTCHSKIEKNDISIEQVWKKKLELVTAPNKSHGNSASPVNFNKKVGNAIVGNHNRVVINQGKKKEKYPPGSIGYDTIKGNFISHLIERYHTYKEAELGKQRMNYAIFPSRIKSHFGIGKNRTILNIPIERFQELTTFIQKNIEGTMVAKRNGKGHKNFSTFDEYLKQQNAPTSNENLTAKDQRPIYRLGKEVHFFSERLGHAFPGLRGNRIEWYDGQVAIDRLQILLSQPLSFRRPEDNSIIEPLWWIRDGSRGSYITDFRSLDKNKVLLSQNQELLIDRIAVARGIGNFDFVYVETLADLPSGAYNHTKEEIEERVSNRGFFSEEYAVVNNAPITLECYDDGAAEIGGKIIRIRDDVRSKIRYLSKYNFIISCDSVRFNTKSYLSESRDWYNGVLAGVKDYKDFFNWLLSLRTS